MRAFNQGIVGPYNSHTGLSVRVFDVFRTDAVTFEEIVRTNGMDEGVLAALKAIHEPSPEEIAAVNLVLSWRPEGDPKWVAWVHGIMDEEWLAPRLDLVTFFDSIDADEGREVPIGGRARLSADGTVMQPVPAPVA